GARGRAAGRGGNLPPAFHGLTASGPRHMVVAPEVLGDVLAGTRRTASVFLPGTAGGGPTTRQRMDHYARHAGPLALEASRRALGQSGLAPGGVPPPVTVSCPGFVAPGGGRVLVPPLEVPAA